MTGAAGAGTGALTATFKGGLGTASTVMDNGITIGALVAVNALGSATIGDTRHFWAAPFEEGVEFGGLGMPQPFPQDARELRIKFRARTAGNAKHHHRRHRHRCRSDEGGSEEAGDLGP